MTTVYFPWEHLEHLGKFFLFVMQGIQQPWRFLGAASVLMTFMAVAAFGWMKREGKEAALRNAVSVIMVLTVILAGYFLTDYMRQNEKIYYCDEQDVSDEEIGTGEYFLQGASFGYSDEILCSEGVNVLASGRKEDIFVVECVNLSESEQYVDIPVLNYPNYEAVDSATGGTLAIDTGEECRIRVWLSGYYQGEIRIEYQSPWYWRMSEIITVLTAIGLIVYCGQLTTLRAGGRKICCVD